MPRYARLDQNDNIVEVREFTKKLPDAEIPHKGVRWRPYEAEGPVPDYDSFTQSPEIETVIESDRVLRRWAVKPRPVADVRAAAIAQIKSEARDRIIDALPDLAAVAAIKARLDAVVAKIEDAPDVKSIAVVLAETPRR